MVAPYQWSVLDLILNAEKLSHSSSSHCKDDFSPSDLITQRGVEFSLSDLILNQSWHSVGPEPIPDSNRTDKLRVSVGSVPPFLDSRSVRYFHSVGTQGH